MNTYTHPADVPSVAPMDVQLDAARAIRAGGFFDQSREARADAVELARFGRLLDWYDGVAIYTRDGVRTVIRERDNRVMQVIW